MLYVTVDHLNVNRYVAHALVVPVIMFVVSYAVHRYRSFGDRPTQGHKSKKRYAVVRLGGMGVSKVSFFVLVAVVGLPYLVVSLTITLGLAWPTYRLMRDWAFVQEVEVQLAESPGALASA
jgi:putative flippase GtrA